MDPKTKILKAYRATVKGIDEDGNVRALIGPSSIDRDGEIIEPAAWEKAMPAFMAHPILLQSHDWSDLKNQIGEVVGYKVTPEGNEVTLRYYHGKGNERADYAYYLATQGVAAFSHGFYGLKWTDNPNAGKSADTGAARRVFHEIELLEVSQVLVPCNPDALQKSLDAALGKAAAPAPEETHGITITLDATNAASFAEFLKSKTAAIEAAVKGSTTSAYDLILDQDAGDSQATTDDDALKMLSASVAEFTKSLKEN